MELLAPAGNFESLKAAVFNGANAIYFGINKFNARNNIDGFSESDIEEVVSFCHLRNVKVYMAINILFKDEELQSALDLVCYANNLGVDAFIIQDLGFANLIKENFPHVVLHASTQMAVHNLEGVVNLKEFGFSRVVLARETTLEEIKRITKNSDMEIEYFCQGALCVSFSGNCYMSSYLCGKSGNRGLCAQYCRHNYDFVDNGKTISSGFLLSAKDICLINYLKQLKDAGVCSLKIEGRARRPVYVASVCKTYRKCLDKNFSTSKTDTENLKLAFNRDFTPAYFNGNQNIISNYSNHIGIAVGKIEKINFGKRFNEIFVNTKYDLTPKSVLKIFDGEKEFATLSPYDVKRDDKFIRFTTTAKLKVGLTVNLINDASVEEQLLSYEPKIKLPIEIFALANKKLKLKYKDFEKEYFMLESSKTKPFTEKDFETSFKKSKEFDISCKTTTNGVFVLNSQLNEARKDFLENIKQLILNNYLIKNNILKINKNIKINLNNEKINKISVFDYIIVKDLINLKNILNNNKIIIFSPEIYNKENILKFNEFMGNRNWYLDLPNFCTQEEVEFFKQIIKETGAGVVVNNLWAISLVTKKIGGSFLNVYNSESIKTLSDFGIKKFFIAELSEAEVKDLKVDMEYAYREKIYMTLRLCPIKQIFKTDCSNCKFKKGLRYKLKEKEFLLDRKKCKTCTFYLTD